MIVSVAAKRGKTAEDYRVSWRQFNHGAIQNTPERAPRPASYWPRTIVIAVVVLTQILPLRSNDPGA